MRFQLETLRSLVAAGLLLTLLVLAVNPSASAGKPEAVKVTAADPSEAEQGAIALDITITGDGFGTDSEVEFLVTETEDPGGITVGPVNRRGPKELVVTIEVAEDATIEFFDIRVSPGRRRQ